MPAGVIGPRGRITTILVASYTLSDTDNRNTLVFNFASTVTVTIPLGLQIGWTANIIVQGAGDVTFSLQTGVTLNNLNGDTGVSGQYAEGVLKAVSQDVFDLSNVTAAPGPILGLTAGIIPVADSGSSLVDGPIAVVADGVTVAGTGASEVAHISGDNATFSEIDSIASDGAFAYIGQLTGGSGYAGTSENSFDLTVDNGASTILNVTSVDNLTTLFGALQLLPLAFADLPATPAFGMIAAISDSDTVVWGATIGGGSTSKVLGFYNGTNWTVTAK